MDRFFKKLVSRICRIEKIGKKLPVIFGENLSRYFNKKLEWYSFMRTTFFKCHPKLLTSNLDNSTQQWEWSIEDDVYYVETFYILTLW